MNFIQRSWNVIMENIKLKIIYNIYTLHLHCTDGRMPGLCFIVIKKKKALLTTPYAFFLF